MAIDIIARGLAAQLVDSSGKISADKMPTLSKAPEGVTFNPIGALTDPSLVEGKTAEEILLMMLYGIVNPVLTDPTLSIVLSEDNAALVIGRASALKGALTFSRGKIDPAFGTSGNRAGAPLQYQVGENVFETSNTSYDFEIEIIPESKEVLLNYSVTYGEGEQPLNSVGQPFGAPLTAGTLASSITLQAAHPLYTPEGEDKKFEIFTDEDGQGYLSTFESEKTTGVKQSFVLSTETTVIGVKALNPMTQQWEWIGGSAAASLTYFDTELLQEGYIKYTYNSTPVGARELRIYTT